MDIGCPASKNRITERTTWCVEMLRIDHARGDHTRDDRERCSWGALGGWTAVGDDGRNTRQSRDWDIRMLRSYNSSSKSVSVRSVRGGGGGEEEVISRSIWSSDLQIESSQFRRLKLESKLESKTDQYTHLPRSSASPVCCCSDRWAAASSCWTRFPSSHPEWTADFLVAFVRMASSLVSSCALFHRWCEYLWGRGERKEMGLVWLRFGFGRVLIAWP